MLSASSTSKISHPVGTTVKVIDLLAHHPVRKQTVLKSPAKLLENIKKILQVHAIAKPSMKLSLKILKAPNDNGDWLYAPKRDPTLMDAASGVFGPKVLIECEMTSWDSGNTICRGRDVSDRDLYVFTAVLPKRGCGTFPDLIVVTH